LYIALSGQRPENREMSASGYGTLHATTLSRSKYLIGPIDASRYLSYGYLKLLDFFAVSGLYRILKTAFEVSLSEQ